jgi:hypothetical protein
MPHTRRTGRTHASHFARCAMKSRAASRDEAASGEGRRKGGAGARTAAFLRAHEGKGVTGRQAGAAPYNDARSWCRPIPCPSYLARPSLVDQPDAVTTPPCRVPQRWRSSQRRKTCQGGQTKKDAAGRKIRWARVTRGGRAGAETGARVMRRESCGASHAARVMRREPADGRHARTRLPRDRGKKAPGLTAARSTMHSLVPAGARGSVREPALTIRTRK